MNKLRLIMFTDCNRSCGGCCNRDFDIKSLPVVGSFKGYERIMLTGGEPMLYPGMVAHLCTRIRKETDTPIILYTAKTKRVLDLVAILHWVDGLTVTLHEQYDVAAFRELHRYVGMLPSTKQLRLNVFSSVNIDGVDTTGWQVKENIEWIKDCPLPEGEVLMRLDIGVI